MKALDYLAPFAVMASLVALGARPTWVSVGAFAVAVLFYAAERVSEAYRFAAERGREHSLVVAQYGVEVEDLRAEVKTLTDAVRSFTSTAAVNKRLTF